MCLEHRDIIYLVAIGRLSCLVLILEFPLGVIQIEQGCGFCLMLLLLNSKENFSKTFILLKRSLMEAYTNFHSGFPNTNVITENLCLIATSPFEMYFDE